jgi:hypothetical protein
VHCEVLLLRDYSLLPTFVGTMRRRNKCQSGVPVSITEVIGDTVLETNSEGLFVFGSLPKGRYTFAASYSELHCS